MNKSWHVQFVAPAFLAALGCICQALPAPAQNGPRKEAPAAKETDRAASDVAVIDVAKIFRHAHQFHQEMDKLKTDVAQFEENDVRFERARIKRLGEKLQQFKTGSPQYRTLEEKVNKDMATLQVELTLKKKQFMQREAKIYAEQYAALEKTVANYARNKGFRVVIRFDSARIDAEDREQVLKSVNNSVVFQDNLDITDEVTKRLNGEKTDDKDSAKADPPGRRHADRSCAFAVIDVTEVFEKCDSFQSKMEEIKTQVQDFERQIQQQRIQIQSAAMRLKMLKSSSAEYEKLERQLVASKIEMDVSIEKSKKEILDREASLYAVTYSIVKQEVAAYARTHGIRSVIRYESEPIDPMRRNSVLKGINRQVLFQDDLDITDAIIKRVNQVRLDDA